MTSEEKVAFIHGYAYALAQLHAEEFNRDVNAVLRELLQSAIEKGKI